MEAQAGVCKTYYALRVFDQEHHEVETMFQSLASISELHPLFVRLTGLAQSRIAAHDASGELCAQMQCLEEELQMRITHLHKVAARVCAEYEGIQGVSPEACSPGTGATRGAGRCETEPVDARPGAPEECADAPAMRYERCTGATKTFNGWYKLLQHVRTIHKVPSSELKGTELLQKGNA
jgi:hypothetical protein